MVILVGMRWVLLGACVLFGCSGEAFSGDDEKAAAKGGEAGETATGGALSGSGGAPTGGKSGSGGKATGGTNSEGGEPATGGTETGGTGAAAPTGGTGSGGSAGCAEPSTFYLDFDGDGYGRDSETVEACEAPDGYADQGGDCADLRANQADENPGAPELCNGLDDNCNDEADEGAACPSGCVAEEGGSVIRCEEAATWAAAVETCESVGSQLTMDYRVAFSAVGLGESWLGASDSSGAWLWLSGEPVPRTTGSSSGWETGEPSTGHCMKYRTGFASEDCAAALPFICVEP